MEIIFMLALVLALCLLGSITARTLAAPMFVPLQPESIAAFRRERSEAKEAQTRIDFRQFEGDLIANGVIWPDRGHSPISDER